MAEPRTGRDDALCVGDEVVEVITRCSERGVLEGLAVFLVSGRLVACAHVRGPFESWYHWEDVIEHTQEWELDVVTTPELLGACRSAIESLHPYDTPSVTWRFVSCSTRYGEWVLSSVLAGSEGFEIPDGGHREPC
jgi:periplasmic divalent cation tolerance protein